MCFAASTALTNLDCWEGYKEAKYLLDMALEDPQEELEAGCVDVPELYMGHRLASDDHDLAMGKLVSASVKQQRVQRQVARELAAKRGSNRWVHRETENASREDVYI